MILPNIICGSQRFAAASKYFDSLEDTTTPIDALEEWIGSPIVNTQQDPIVYWTGMQAAGHPLATMALDFLSIPGMDLFLCTLLCLINIFLY